MKAKAITIIALLGCTAVAACGGSDLSTEDAHDTANRCRYLTRADQVPGTTREDQANIGACLDDRQKRSIAFPNHFPNVATACDGYGHRIFTTTDRDFRLIADPSCPGWTKDTPRMGASVEAGQ
jgi:hypothetical protein